jgi:hypothetical protein
VLDRTLVLRTERRQQFTPEEVQLQLIARNRNALWTELLCTLNRIVKHLRNRQSEARQVTFRMADFANVALSVAETQGYEAEARAVFQKLEAGRSDLLLADEPIAICLQTWLERPENPGRGMTSGALAAELGAIGAGSGVAWPHRSGHALGQRLSHIATNLRQRFEVAEERDSANQKLYRFGPKAESLNQVESQSQAIQAAQVANSEAVIATILNH